MNAAPQAALPIDVLIVGAGPTGLLLATELRRFGVAVRLVEKLAAPSPLSRAIALHARTLELLEELGVAERFVQAGVRYRRARLFAGPSSGSEGEPIGAAMLRATALATTVGTLRAPLARAVRDRVAGFLASLEPVQQRLVRSVAELDLSYRRSELVAEHQEPLLEARVGAAEAGEDPSVGSWLAFRAAPRAGDRALDARVEDKHGKPVQLRSLFGRGRHLLLLFDGRATTIEGDARLTQVARDAASRFGAAVDVVIVTSRPRGASLTRACPVLYDPEGEAEARYGATTECGYLVRPDLHVGFRCQPVRGDLIVEHLATRVGLATREGLVAAAPRPTGAP